MPSIVHRDVGSFGGVTDGPDREALTAFFDLMYTGAHRDPRAIPWARLAPDRWLLTWLAGRQVAPGTALVVGSGLGDDAEELAGRGWSVTAFDVSPAAIQWARDRHPASTVAYQVADLFHLPAEWRAAFGLVVDVRTVQSLPPGRRNEVMAAVAAPVGPGGTLLAVADARAVGAEPAGPPWPLSRGELLGFEGHGLDLVSLDEDGGELFGEFRRG